MPLNAEKKQVHNIIFIIIPQCFFFQLHFLKTKKKPTKLVFTEKQMDAEEKLAQMEEEDDAEYDGEDEEEEEDGDEEGTSKKQKSTGGVLRKMMGLVQRILQQLPGFSQARGYRVYLDQGYSSLPLANWLNERGHYFTMSMQSTQPSFLFKEGLHKGGPGARFFKGQLRWAIKNESAEGHHPILAATWSDRAKFNCLTNMHDPRDVVPKTPKQTKWAAANSQTAQQPQVIPAFAGNYRLNYHAVDIVSQQTRSLIFKHRCRKWPLTILHGVLVWSTYNAWQLFTHNMQEHNAVLPKELTNLTYLEFTDLLIDQLAYLGASEVHYYHQQFVFF